jgi:hypothetical protein
MRLIDVFFFSTFVLTQKWSKKSRQALIAPRILPAIATGRLRYYRETLGHESSTLENVPW